jgi:[acyl-carrier-protein] S-malonyltransferase
MLDLAKTALLFPGQGSQFVGMGKALSDSFRMARQTFEEADDILGFSLSALAWDGPESELLQTANTQPALYVSGIAALRVLYEVLGEDFRPAYVAGHSLGQLTALTAAGSISFPEGLRLVRKRGELMRDADQNSPGGMAAILGLTVDQAESVCAQAQSMTGKEVVVANDNCPGQVVIAGDDTALASAMEAASAAGAKRVMKLDVSIAAHSPLMGEAAAEFRQALSAIHFHPPQIPIVGNASARSLTTVDQIVEDLTHQLTSRVRWTESVQTMLDAGITTFLELGSKDVLKGLVKRISRDATTYVVDSPEGMETVKQL